MWQSQIAALSDAFTVVAWDEPGAGRSSDVPADFGLTGLRRLPRGADRGPRAWPGACRRPLLGRHGRPGALPRPSRARRDADPHRYLRGLEGVAARGGGACPRRGRTSDARSARRGFDPTLPGLFAGVPPAEFVPLLEEIAADVRPDTLRTQLLVMAEADERDVLPRISVPTLLVWGKLDARSPLSVGRQFEQAIADATLVVIPGAGHVSQLEQPTWSTPPYASSAAPTRHARPQDQPLAARSGTARRHRRGFRNGGKEGAGRQGAGLGRSRCRPNSRRVMHRTESGQWRGRLLNERLRSRGSAAGVAVTEVSLGALEVVVGALPVRALLLVARRRSEGVVGVGDGVVEAVGLDARGGLLPGARARGCQGERRAPP